MNRKKVLVLILMLTTSSIVLIPPALQVYDEIADEWADPSYNGPGYYPRYSGGAMYFYVDIEFPESKITMIKNSTNRNYTKDARLTTYDSNWEASIGGKYWWKVKDVPIGPDIYERWDIYIEWWVANYTIEVYDWTWGTWNGTHWVEEYAWSYEFQGFVLAYSGSSDWDNNSVRSYELNITLMARWWGFI